jgi:hypothetical protein
MEIVEWLNENELRAYPLIEGKTIAAIPDNTILDLQLVLDENTSPVGAELIDFTVGFYQVTINFTGNNSFSFSYTNGETGSLSDISYPLYLRNDKGSLLVLGKGLMEVETYSTIVCNVPVEPATVYQFGGAWLGVTSLNSSPKYLSIANSVEPELPLVVDETTNGVIGDVELDPGYNFRINFNNNLINMAAGFGYGLQMSCNTHFIDPSLLDCPDIVSYINGVPPDSSGVFRFTAGSNIYLFDGNSVADPIYDKNVTPELTTYTDLSGKTHDGLNANTLFVGLTFLETDLCSPVQLLPTNN